MTRIVVHIDSVVLHGVTSGQRAHFSRTLRAELARQLATPEGARSLARRSDVQRLVVRPVIRHTERPAQLGRDVARTIARGLKA